MRSNSQTDFGRLGQTLKINDSMIEYTFEGNYFYTKCIKCGQDAEKTVTSGRTSPASKESRIFFSSTDPTDSSDSIFHDPLKKTKTKNKPRTLVVRTELEKQGAHCRHAMPAYSFTKGWDLGTCVIFMLNL